MENKTHGETTEGNDNQEQMQTQDMKITKEKVGLRPAHQPLHLTRRGVGSSTSLKN
jgi:hypothetical protein